MEWPAVGALAILTIVLGCIGFRQYYLQAGDPQSPTNLLYLTLQLFVLQSGWVDASVPLALDVARFLAPALAAYTAINALAVLFSSQLRLLRLRNSRDHVVVCGLGRKGEALSDALLSRGKRVVAIEQDEACAGLARLREDGGTSIVGDATSEYVLRRAGVARATRIVCLCNDETNAAIALAVQQMPRHRRSPKLTCHVHLTDFEVWRLMRHREIESDYGEFGIRMEFFNAYDAAAAILLDPRGRYAPSASLPQHAQPHVVIVGLGGLAQSVIAHLAQLWYLDGGVQVRRPVVTAIDLAASQKAEALRLRFPALAQACDLVPIDIDVKSPAYESAEFVLASARHGGRPVVYVCFDDDRRSLQAALTLWQRVRHFNVLVVARMADERGLGNLLQGSAAGVVAFPLLSLTCTPERIFEGTHERMARALYDEHSQARGDAQIGSTPVNETDGWSSLGDNAREDWRREADELGMRLERAGYGISPLTDWRAEPVPFSAAEIDAMESRETHKDGLRALPLLLARAGFGLYKRGHDGINSLGGDTL